MLVKCENCSSSEAKDKLGYSYSVKAEKIGKAVQ